MSVLKPNKKLKLALIEKGRQIDTCRAVGIHPSKLSGIIGGYLKAPKELKIRLSKYLCKPIQELFPEE